MRRYVAPASRSSLDALRDRRVARCSCGAWVYGGNDCPVCIALLYREGVA